MLPHAHYLGAGHASSSEILQTRPEQEIRGLFVIAKLKCPQMC
jgi:hypothetical protein